MNPTAKEIRKARDKAGLTQRQAADLLYKESYTWGKWEQGINKMHWGDWELFHIKAKLEMKS